MLPLEWRNSLLRSPEPCAAPLRVQLLPAPEKVAAFSASHKGEKGRPPERDCSLPGAVDPVLSRILGSFALSWHLLQVTSRSSARGCHFAGPPLLPGPQALFAVTPPPSHGPAPSPLGSPSLSSPFPCLSLWTSSPKPSLQSAWGEPSRQLSFLQASSFIPAVAKVGCAPLCTLSLLARSGWLFPPSGVEARRKNSPQGGGGVEFLEGAAPSEAWSHLSLVPLAASSLPAWSQPRASSRPANLW